MTIEKIKRLIDETASHILFCYSGKSCGIDPFCTHYEIWCGERDGNFKTLDEAINAKIFDGKSLNEIIDATYDWNQIIKTVNWYYRYENWVSWISEQL